MPVPMEISATAEVDTGFVADQALVDSLNSQRSLLIPIGEAIALKLDPTLFLL